MSDDRCEARFLDAGHIDRNAVCENLAGWRVDSQLSVHLACEEHIGNFTDFTGRLNIVTVFDAGDMACEAHPRRLWPHDACVGPGMPVRASLREDN